MYDRDKENLLQEYWTTYEFLMSNTPAMSLAQASLLALLTLHHLPVLCRRKKAAARWGGCRGANSLALVPSPCSLMRFLLHLPNRPFCCVRWHANLLRLRRLLSFHACPNPFTEKVRMVEVSLLGDEEVEGEEDVQVSRFEIVSISSLSSSYSISSHLPWFCLAWESKCPSTNGIHTISF